MLRNLEQIQNPKKSRRTCQLRSNVRKPDRFDRVHFDLTFFHAIAGAHSYVWTHPDSDTTVISPRRTPSRRRLANNMLRIYSNASPSGTSRDQESECLF